MFSRRSCHHTGVGGNIARNQGSQVQEARRVYDLHVKPIEDAHVGEYALVAPDGRVTFALTLEDVMRRAHERASPDNFIFRVGRITLGRV
jgi:hypothetical protein